jgi:hypothetical protein
MAAERSVKPEKGGGLLLPPGFRFHPTDEEVITSYLLQKFLNPSFDPQAIGEVDLNKCEPWDLPSKYLQLLHAPFCSSISLSF